MTSRELTSGFDFWPCGHLCMAVMHLPTMFGADIFIQSGVIDIFPKLKMAAILDVRDPIIGSLLHVWSLRLGSSTVVCHSYCTTICTGWMFLSGCSTSWRWWSTVVWDGEPRRTLPITACRSPRFLVASICDPAVAVNSSFLASVAALSALVLSPLRAQQFGILCLTVCVIQLLGLISFDVTWNVSIWVTLRLV